MLCQRQISRDQEQIENRKDRTLTGQALSVLDQSGDSNNTIVIFMSDHGPTFQHGKMTQYDLGLRVPLIIRGPEIVPGAGCDELVSEFDVPHLDHCRGRCRFFGPRLLWWRNRYSESRSFGGRRKRVDSALTLSQMMRSSKLMLRSRKGSPSSLTSQSMPRTAHCSRRARTSKSTTTAIVPVGNRYGSSDSTE